MNDIFQQAGTDKGPIPIRGTVNDGSYQQTLVKYEGSWRLYINTIMLKNSPKRIGETVVISIEYDPTDRSLVPHPKLVAALAKNAEAKYVFDALPPSLQKEIVRYISRLKTEATIDKNVAKAIDFLLGRGRFIGRERLK
ncbi:YdeI/OmpD-associated family protein [Pseudocnuella soli]|uniref:YdeI/OmpD-associated family protein n=1 Tax=Pseudocnuella soli TaxID=2502779 RepID=UPI001F025A35|nr:YdeI/OmpD-associated family protein [Pseudocnuella soli]